MFIVKKIITAKQLKTVKAKDASQGRVNSVMKDFREKGGAALLRNRKVYQKQFWSALRADSKERKSEGGDKGFTKKSLEGFFAKKLNDKTDNFSDRRIRKIFTKIYDLKRSRIVRKAAQLRHEEHAIQLQQETQQKAEEKRNKEVEFRNHVSDIIAKGRSQARVGVQVSSVATPSGVSNFAYAGERKEHDLQHDGAINFEESGKNSRNAEFFLAHPDMTQAIENNSNNFGQLLFLKNKQHNFVKEEEDEDRKIKARLARIQGKADNHEK